LTGKILRQKFGPPSKVNGPEMSFRLHLANLVLRLFEKPHLTRATPQELRVAFERKAQVFFHPPKGTVFSRQHLKTPSGSLQLQWVQPAQTSQGGVILYFHGGGYVFGSARSHRAMLAKLASLTGCRACLPDYRLAPEHPFPAALEDARAAYQGLLGQGCRPEDIVLGGDSAGGGLALALLHSLLSQGQTSPAGVFCFSPLTDMTFSGSSLRSNARSDVVLPVCRVREVGQMYLREHGPQDPYVSPLFGVFKGASPVLTAKYCWMTRVAWRKHWNVTALMSLAIFVTITHMYGPSWATGCLRRVPACRILQLLFDGYWMWQAI
jgi:monoterpene epsilon-lactone hydrolase